MGMELTQEKQTGLNEWLISDDDNLKFHLGQINSPYRSTIAFESFLKGERGSLDNSVLCEVGCGAGQVLGYFLRNNATLKGYGIDVNSELVDYGNALYQKYEINGELRVDDLYNLSLETLKRRFDGIILLQVINILPEYKKAIESLQRLKHDWIAFSMLGFEGNIDYVCTLYDYNKNKEIDIDPSDVQNDDGDGGGYSKVFYNIWSLSRMKNFFCKIGYKKFVFKKFEMDVDLPNEHPGGRGTYTVKLENGSRMQISGGMWMPWYFVYAEK